MGKELDEIILKREEKKRKKRYSSVSSPEGEGPERKELVWGGEEKPIFLRHVE